MQVSKKAGFPSRLLAGLLTAALSIPAVVPVAYAQGSGQEQASKLSQAQLESLVAPIALYPDSLLSQVLMASTYPLEVAEAANWQTANKNLKGSALNNALQQQTWDASVKSLVSFPSALQMMGSQLNWTQKLGNAVLAQQSDTMAAIQALRAKAKQSGALQSTQQQTVSSQGSAIVIQPADPQVVYVPTYNPTVVYGAWPYPSYPPYTYYPPGYVAGTALLSFGVGMAVGAALWGGCHWGGGYGGGNSLTVNNNTYNNFNRNTNRNWSGNGRGTSDWKPDQQRRNANLGGGNQNAEREQLRQNLQKDGLNGDNRGGDRNLGDRSGGDRPDANRGGDRSGGQSNFRNDSSGFGDARGARFNSGGGDRFGGGGARVGGGEHFGGGGGGFRGRR